MHHTKISPRSLRATASDPYSSPLTTIPIYVTLSVASKCVHSGIYLQFDEDTSKNTKQEELASDLHLEKLFIRLNYMYMCMNKK